MLLCGMNFMNLTHIQFIFGIEDQLILSYNPVSIIYDSLNFIPTPLEPSEYFLNFYYTPIQNPFRGAPKKLDFYSSKKSLEFFYAINIYFLYSIGLR